MAKVKKQNKPKNTGVWQILVLSNKASKNNQDNLVDVKGRNFKKTKEKKKDKQCIKKWMREKDRNGQIAPGK